MRLKLRLRAAKAEKLTEMGREAPMPMNCETDQVSTTSTAGESS